MKTAAILSVVLLSAGMLAFTSLTACARKAQMVAQAPAPISRSAPPPAEPVGIKADGMLVVYPSKTEAVINAPASFIIGAVPPGSSLTINSAPVKTNAQGFFAHVVQLKVGANQFSLAKDGTPALDMTIKRAAPPAPLSASPLQIAKNSAEPREDIGAAPGDVLQFAVRATPGSKVAVHLSGHAIALAPAASGGKKPAVNFGLDTAYGMTYQKTPAAVQDLYTGFYKVQANDDWKAAQPVISVSKGGQTVKATVPGRVTVMHQPYVASTLHDDTVVRVGPGKARTTPFVQGVRVLVDGFKGDEARIEVAANKHLWILKQDLTRESDEGSYPESSVRTINIEDDGASDARIVVPLTQRLPYQAEQQSGAGGLKLRIFGATSDTDWITPQVPQDQKHLIDGVTWAQRGDKVYELSVTLAGKQQWGYFVSYEGTNLVLNIRRPPTLSGGSLSGLTIAIDPGHGGHETGSIGCSGIKEATVNLAIARKLKAGLERDGANVVMTRTEDLDVSLAQRVQTAIAARADLLLSVHCNALPDGRNPWTEHGTASFWYQPQSTKFARHIKNAMVAATGFPDHGCRWQNLFLCRPTQMVASLAEVGFMINPDEYAQLIDEKGQARAAEGLRQGVHTFLNEALETSRGKNDKEHD